MFDFDSIFLAVCEEARIPQRCRSIAEAIEEIASSDDLASVPMQEALGRLKELVDSHYPNSYGDLCGVIWNLKFYRAAIGDTLRTTPKGKTLLSHIEQLDQEIKKTVRPRLMRRSVELTTTKEQLQDLRELEPRRHLELPGSE